MPILKDDPLKVKDEYVAIRWLNDDEGAWDNSSQGSDEDDGSTAWDADNSGNSDTDSGSYIGGSSSNGSKSEYCGVYDNDSSTAWYVDNSGNSDTGSSSGASTSGSKSVKGKKRDADRDKWFEKLRMIFYRLQVDK